ncbi:DMT family transporter [Microlunatus sp. Gsoil 973]|uniref:DMT family transporter n=1 Tax=Microlunatus sp. Gsoil 973 TaxID=2672569 RepID=UPI001E4F11F9|nr:DMT family transporter [Microlunatus sp. Gsoil 973]
MTTTVNAPAAPATRASATVAMSVTILLWASAFVVIRWAAPYLSPGPLALLRLLPAAVAMTAFVFVRARRSGLRVPTGRPLALTVGYGVAWFAGYTVALNWAEHHLDAGTAAMLVNVAPILIALGAGLFFGEGLPKPLFLGTGIALIGVVLIGSTTGSGHSDLLGLALGLLAALLYTVSLLTQKVVLRSVDPLVATWTGCVAGMLATLPFAGQALGEVVQAPASATVAAILLGIGPTAIGFSTWAYAQSHLATGRLAAASLIIPVVAMIISAITLRELPPVPAIIGGLICLGGVVVSRRRA